MNDERRHVYRVAPGDEDGLQVTLHTEAGEVSGDEIVDVTIEGAGARFESGGTPALVVGDAATLRFNSPALNEPVEVSATVVARKEVELHRHYSFRFEGHELERALPREFYRLFNRRGAYRAAEPSDSSPIQVTMKVAAEADGEQVASAKLKNISATGLGALADADTASRLEGITLVEISLQLPDVPRTLRLAAWIRNQETTDDNVYYGLMFDSKRTEDFLEQLEEIGDYVMCRYRESVADRIAD